MKMSVIEFNGEVFTKTKMSGSPLVSIILPFLNAEKFIQETIESVLAQTYKTWELLLVDDSSTDASTNIAHRIAQQYPQKVRYLEHPGHQNRGLSTSRNLVLCQPEFDESDTISYTRLWPFGNGALVDQARAGWCCAEIR
jgi:glycosyltransferase involved in cell wall biosynthesis